MVLVSKLYVLPLSDEYYNIYYRGTQRLRVDRNKLTLIFMNTIFFMFFRMSARRGKPFLHLLCQNTFLYLTNF